MTTFHDLIPILAFEEMRFKFSRLIPLYTKFTWKLSGAARRIIANSTQTKEELIEELGIEPGKIDVIPLGVDQRFRCAGNRIGHTSTTTSFFGNFTYRKGAHVAVKVFREVSQKIDLRLILAGGRIRTLYQRHFDLKKLIKGLRNVQVIEHVPDEDLVKLYIVST